MLLDITRQTPLLPQTPSETKRNNLIDASDSAGTLRNFSAPLLFGVCCLMSAVWWCDDQAGTSHATEQLQT
jgi:hypothetical protein